MAPVVLVHGFLVGPWSMLYLDQKVHQAGFATHRFGFSSRHVTLAEAARELEVFCQRINNNGPCHLVAHSLGGLVALEMLQSQAGGVHKRPLLPGHLVLLGSPVRSAKAAAGLGQFWWGQRLLGQAQASLNRSFDRSPDGWSTTVIAGTQSMGLGHFFSPLPLPNDGTVAVAETQLKGARSLEVKASHSGLLFSSQVAKLTLRALQA